MRRLMILVLAGLVWLAPAVLAASPEPDPISTITGQELADALGQWDGYDFQDAGDVWPGALRSGPSEGADPSDPYGADGTVLILPSLDDTAHPVVTVRLSSVAAAGIWDNYQRIMDELGFAETDQQAVYAALGQVLGEAYAQADDQEHSHVAAVDVAPYRVLWQSRTSGFEADDPDQPIPAFAMPEGGVTLEIVPPDEDPVVVPAPEPTPTPTPVKTPKPTVRPTHRPTPSPSTEPAAPAPTHFVCNGSDTVITDPLSKGWSIEHLSWANKTKYDRITLTLGRSGKGGDGTQAIVHVMPIEDVKSTLKVTAPSAGDTAIALGLFQDVKGWNYDQAKTMPAVKWITMDKDDNGYPWMVLGVKGDACYSLQVPAWTADHPKAESTIQVVVDVKH
jgi:hypothetical protein